MMVTPSPFMASHSHVLQVNPIMVNPTMLATFMEKFRGGQPSTATCLSGATALQCEEPCSLVAAECEVVAASKHDSAGSDAGPDTRAQT
jgi:hypothetical protein